MSPDNFISKLGHLPTRVRTATTPTNRLHHRKRIRQHRKHPKARAPHSNNLIRQNLRNPIDNLKLKPSKPTKTWCFPTRSFTKETKHKSRRATPHHRNGPHLLI